VEFGQTNNSTCLEALGKEKKGGPETSEPERTQEDSFSRGEKETFRGGHKEGKE